MEEIDIEMQKLAEDYDIGLQYIYSFSSTDIDVLSIHSSSSTEIEDQSIFSSSSTEIGSDDDESIHPEKNIKGGVLSEKEGLETCLAEIAKAVDGKGRKKVSVVKRSIIKSSRKESKPPPDGGREAWVQVALGHLVVMNTRGFINSFGVFQTYYVTNLQKTPSAISWVGSVQIFLLFFISAFSGRLTDAGYFRTLFLIGSLLGVFGLYMASLSTQYWQLFLTQGVCCGIGNGCLFCPSLSLVSTYFSRRRALALGIVAAGSATGGMVFPALVEQLLPKVGFGWTMRSLAFIQLACLFVCNLFMRTRLHPRRTGALVDWKSFKEVTYSLFATGMFFVFLGVYFAYFYIGAFGQEIVHLSYAESINLLIVLNSMGALGRVASGFVGDRYLGGQNTLILIVALTSLLLFCWVEVTTQAGLYAWAVLYGIVGATIQTLFPATLSSLTPDLRMAGTRMGMVFTILSFAVLIGPPAAGQLIQMNGGGYEYAQLFAGGVMLVGCCFLIAARYSTKKKFFLRI